MSDLIAKMIKNSKTLEDRFFYAENRVLAEQLELLKRQEDTIGALSKVSGITDKSVLLELIDLGVRPETLTALCLAPVIEVAWADGTLDNKERDALLKAARKVTPGADHPIVREWLQNKPDLRLRDAWERYMYALCEILSKESIAVLKTDIMGHAKQVAEASGGFLGLKKPVSAAELAMIERIAAFFKKPGPCEI